MRTWLAEAMDKEDMTQRRLGVALGLAPSTISMYVTGKRTPKVPKAKEIVRALNLPPESWTRFFDEEALNA